MPTVQPLPPVNAPFVPPTFGWSDPWKLSQGLKGVERGAAARGTLLTGGTQKALMDYGIHSAEQDYGNDYQRALQTYTTNRDTNMLNYGQQRTGYADQPPTYLPPSYAPQPWHMDPGQQQSQIDQATAQSERNRAEQDQQRTLAQQQLANASAQPRSWSEPNSQRPFTLSAPASAVQAAPMVDPMEQAMRAEQQRQADAERMRQAQREQEAMNRASADKQNAAADDVSSGALALRKAKQLAEMNALPRVPSYLPYGVQPRRSGA